MTNGEPRVMTGYRPSRAAEAARHPEETHHGWYVALALSVLERMLRSLLEEERAGLDVRSELDEMHREFRRRRRGWRHGEIWDQERVRNR